MAFSPNGKTLATGDDGGTAQLWNPATGQQIRSLTIGSNNGLVGGIQPGRQDPGHRRRQRNGIVEPGYRPADRELATGSATCRWRSARTARPWPPAAPTARPRCGTRPPGTDPQPGTGSIQVVSGVQPGRQDLATGGDDGTARLWNLATGQQIRKLATGSDSVSSVAFSPDSNTLATGGDDGTARLWNLATGQQIRKLATGSDGVSSVAFSPDGNTLATGDDDGTAKVWNLATGQQIRSLATGSTDVNSVAFSPDGKTLATGDWDGTAQLWNVSYLVDVLTRLCSQVGGSLTRAEWTQYVPAGPPYRNVCAQHS